MDCQTAHSLISSSIIIEDCTTLPNGLLRLQTTFEYPGHEHIDVYVRSQASSDAELILTDGGMTVGQLLGFGLDLDGTERRRQFVRGVCQQFGIRREGGQFTLLVPTPTDLYFGRMVIRLAQACSRIADLIVTFQSRLNSTFADDLEEGLAALPLRVYSSVPLIASTGKEIKVDYVIETTRLPAAVFGVSAKSQGSATNRINSTFRKWWELMPRKESYQFVTLLDSRLNYWSERDRDILSDVSEVFEYPAEADALRELVTAE